MEKKCKDYLTSNGWYIFKNRSYSNTVDDFYCIKDFKTYGAVSMWFSIDKDLVDKIKYREVELKQFNLKFGSLAGLKKCLKKLKKDLTN